MITIGTFEIIVCVAVWFITYFIGYNLGKRRARSQTVWNLMKKGFLKYKRNSDGNIEYVKVRKEYGN